MAKQPRHPTRDYYDQKKIRRKRQLLEKIREILECTADESDIVKVAKEVNPEITAEELAEILRLTRAYVREKRGLGS